MATESNSPAKESLSHKFINALVGLVWLYVAFNIPESIVAFFSPWIIQLNVSANIKSFIAQTLVYLMVLGVVSLAIKYYDWTFKDLGLAKSISRSQIKWGLLALPAYYGLYLTLAAIAAKVIPDFNSQIQQHIGYFNSQVWEKIFIFVALVVVAPIVEEILFRGFLFNIYSKQFGFIVATLIVSVLFAFAHEANLALRLDVFTLSLFLCYLRYKTDSIWPSMILHASKNFVAFLVLFVIGIK